MCESERSSYRARAAERKRKSRSHHKDEPLLCSTPTSSKKSYKTPQSLGKAVRRTMKSLPCSPSKKKEVFKNVASSLGFKFELEKEMNVNKTITETESEAQNFFFRTDIVYTTPGVKDEMVVWENGQKKRLRKYYLTMFLREVYAIYKSSVIKPLSFSKFCSIRPKNVLLLKDTPIDQCRCKIHENFSMMLIAVQIKYDDQWWKNILCNNEDYLAACWKGNCIVCQNGKLFCSNNDMSFPVIWKEWVRDPQTGRLQLKSNEGCYGELLENIMELLPQFQEHVRVKRIQSAAFEMDKSRFRVLQVDFAMAYSCEYQNEVQSALWSRASIQLFTAAYFNEDKCKTYLICSDSNDKGKDTIYAYLELLWNLIIENEETEGVTRPCVIYSDGPSCEFKNKYMAKVLHLLSNKYGGEWYWKFFATSHGKGVVDGVGGRAKSLVRQKCMSKSGKTIVQSSKDFFDVIKDLMPSTKVFLFNHNDINEKIKKDNPWENVKEIPGIQRMHVMSAINSKVNLWHTDADDKSAPDLTVNFQDESNDDIMNLQIGEWCLVEYDGSKYAGEIISIPVGRPEFEVSVMVPSGKYWKWPEKPDILFYTKAQIIQKLMPPIVVNSRGLFKFM